MLPITLSLNELCTNSVKYGALSNSAGRIEIGIDRRREEFKADLDRAGWPAGQKADAAQLRHAPNPEAG